jgi:hypothetical protein
MNVAFGGLGGGSVPDFAAPAGTAAIAMGLIAAGLLVASGIVLVVAAWRRRRT